MDIRLLYKVLVKVIESCNNYIASVGKNYNIQASMKEFKDSSCMVCSRLIHAYIHLYLSSTVWSQTHSVKLHCYYETVNTDQTVCEMSIAYIKLMTVTVIKTKIIIIKVLSLLLCIEHELWQ